MMHSSELSDNHRYVIAAPRRPRSGHDLFSHLFWVLLLRECFRHLPTRTSVTSNVASIKPPPCGREMCRVVRKSGVGMACRKNQAFVPIYSGTRAQSYRLHRLLLLRRTQMGSCSGLSSVHLCARQRSLFSYVLTAHDGTTCTVRTSAPQRLQHPERQEHSTTNVLRPNQHFCSKRSRACVPLLGSSSRATIVQ